LLERLPGIHEALRSNPVPPKQTNKQKHTKKNDSKDLAKSSCFVTQANLLHMSGSFSYLHKIQKPASGLLVWRKHFTSFSSCPKLEVKILALGCFFSFFFFFWLILFFAKH
jgi:hypothetical protein